MNGRAKYEYGITEHILFKMYNAVRFPLEHDFSFFSFLEGYDSAMYRQPICILTDHEERGEGAGAQTLLSTCTMCKGFSDRVEPRPAH